MFRHFFFTLIRKIQPADINNKQSNHETGQSGPARQLTVRTGHLNTCEVTAWRAGRRRGVCGYVSAAADGLDLSTHTVGMETPRQCDDGEREGPNSSSGY